MPRTEAQKAARRSRRKPSESNLDETMAEASGAPSSVPPLEEAPPAPSAEDFGDEEWKPGKKLTSGALKALSEQLTDTEVSGYTVASALTGDPRWELIQDEKKQLLAAWRVTLELYGDDPLILKWLPLIGILAAHITPFAGRVMLGPATKEALEHWEKMKRERESAGKKAA